MTEEPELGDLLQERRRLLNLGFRMLGTLHDAEDVAQETYARWYRLSDAERIAVRNPAAWLTRVASRICLDVLGSARARREQYVGEWLPEPVPADTGDPLERVTLDESVRMALLVVLDSLTPAERVAFVLHDVFGLPFEEIAAVVGRTPQACRKLASTARGHIQDRRQGETPGAKHRSVVEAFAAACRSGDLQTLIAVLDPDVTSISDGGGRVSAAINPVRGAERVARFLLGILAKAQDVEARLEQVNGATGLVLRRDGDVTGVVSLNVQHGRVTDVWIVLNPDKLTGWT